MSRPGIQIIHRKKMGVNYGTLAYVYPLCDPPGAYHQAKKIISELSGLPRNELVARHDHDGIDGEQVTIQVINPVCFRNVMPDCKFELIGKT